MTNLTLEQWIGFVTVLALLLGPVLTYLVQSFRWREGEKAVPSSQAVDSYAKSASTAADTITKLLQQIQEIREDQLANQQQLESAMQRIADLETERETTNKRITSLEAEKVQLQNRIHSLETENKELRRLSHTRKGLATT